MSTPDLTTIGGYIPMSQQFLDSLPQVTMWLGDDETMTVRDLLCLYCGRQAFAALNLEITSGRARYPVCSSTETNCIERAFNDARLALDNAAGKHNDAIDTTAS